MSNTHYKYSSLEDFLASAELTVDGELDDGWGARFPVKGRELQAAILFCDISGFSSRSLELNPTETLAFVNNFFAWISAQSLRHFPGIVDKYIGDEVMVVFAREFGSSDPFVDAVQAARWIAENDALDFGPHMGIASGLVTIGYVGTPLRYNCSAFGAPVTLAARCAGIKPRKNCSAWMTFPAEEWKDRDFGAVFPPKKDTLPDGSTRARHQVWELHEPQSAELKNLPVTEVCIIGKNVFHAPAITAVDRARMGVAALKATNRYWPDGQEVAQRKKSAGLQAHAAS